MESIEVLLEDFERKTKEAKAKLQEAKVVIIAERSEASNPGRTTEMGVVLYGFSLSKKHLQELNATYSQLITHPILQSILYYTVLHLTLLIVNVC